MIYVREAAERLRDVTFGCVIAGQSCGSLSMVGTYKQIGDGRRWGDIGAGHSSPPPGRGAARIQVDGGHAHSFTNSPRAMPERKGEETYAHAPGADGAPAGVGRHPPPPAPRPGPQPKPAGEMERSGARGSESRPETDRRHRTVITTGRPDRTGTDRTERKVAERSGTRRTEQNGRNRLHAEQAPTPGPTRDRPASRTGLRHGRRTPNRNRRRSGSCAGAEPALRPNPYRDRAGRMIGRGTREPEGWPSPRSNPRQSTERARLKPDMTHQ